MNYFNYEPSECVSRIGDSASVQAVTRVNAEQASKKDNAQADPMTLSGLSGGDLSY
jgi:hypothetical protein